MRDPARTERILIKLGILWRTRPDTRLCQLVYNLAYNTGKMYNHDIFYVEDDVLEKILDDALKPKDA